jgi:hypothetical protein
VTVFSRLLNSAGAESPLWAKWIERAFKKFSWRPRMVLSVTGRCAVVTALAGDWLETAAALRLVHRNCDEVPVGSGWILG